MTDTGSAASFSSEELDDYRQSFAVELKLIRSLLDCSFAQQAAATSRDFAVLSRVSAERDVLMSALLESEKDLTAGREAAVQEFASGRTSVVGSAILAQHCEAKTLIAQLALQDELTRKAVDELREEARAGTQEAGAGEVTLAAYKRVVAPPPSSAELVNRHG